MRNEERKVSMGQEIREKCNQCSSFLTLSFPGCKLRSSLHLEDLVKPNSLAITLLNV